MKKLETIEVAKLETACGGAGAMPWGQIIKTVKEHLPRPTMPLGPYVPPKPSNWI